MTSGHPPDELLARPVDAGRLYVEHVQRVARWAERLAGPAFDLEDIVHEVFVIACRQLPRFRGESSLATWLFGITDNVVRGRRRRDRWRRWLSGTAEETAGGLPSGAPDPLSVAERRQGSRLVYELLDRVAERDRQVLILFELEGANAEEVALLLGITPANARLRRHRARARFIHAYRQLEDAREEEGRLARSETT